MNRNKAFIIGILVISIIISIVVSNVQAQLIEIDTTADVWFVIDGDTFDAFPVGRIRLADIDAPEFGDAGYDASRIYLISLIGGKQIYLDVDDNYMDDSLERLICVVYVRMNATHLWNVNHKMVLEGHAVIDDFTDNEFNPFTWTETVNYPTELLPTRSYSDLVSDYIQLDSDYDDLDDLYSNLQTLYAQKEVDYNTLETAFDELNNTVYTMLLVHDLNMSYIDLLTEYDQLNTSYVSLNDDYGDLEANYTDMESQHEALQSDYEILEVDFNTANRSFNNLLTDYNSILSQNEQLSSQLSLYQPLSYGLGIAVAVIVIVVLIRSRRSKPLGILPQAS